MVPFRILYVPAYSSTGITDAAPDAHRSLDGIFGGGKSDHIDCASG